METISSNHLSHDSQIVDVMDYLEHNDGIAYSHVVNVYPEWESHVLDGAWFDTEAMGVDPEWSSWLADCIEEACMIQWVDGEPYLFSEEDYLTDPDDFFSTFEHDDIADLADVDLAS